MADITCIALEPTTCDVLIGYSNGYLVEADGVRCDDLTPIAKRITDHNRIRSSTFVGNRPLIACAYIVPSPEEASLVYSSPSVVDKRLCCALSEVGYLAVISLMCGSVLRCVPVPINSHRLAVCGSTVFVTFARSTSQGHDELGDEGGEMAPRKVLVLNAMTTVTANSPSKWKCTEGGSMIIAPRGFANDKHASVVDIASHPQSPFVGIAYEVSKEHTREPNGRTYSMNVVLHVYHSQSIGRYEPYNTFPLSGIAAETSGAERMSRFLAVTFLPTIVRKERSEGAKKSENYGNLLLVVLQSSRVSIVDLSVPTCAIELFHFNACRYNPFCRIATLQSDPYGCVVTTKGGVWKWLTFDDCTAVATRVLTEIRTSNFDSGMSGSALAFENGSDIIPSSHILPERCSSGCWRHSAKLLSAAVVGTPFDVVFELCERRSAILDEQDCEDLWSTPPPCDCKYGATIVPRLYPTHCNVTSVAHDVNGGLLSANVDFISLDINSARITCGLLSKPESVSSQPRVNCSSTTVFIATSPIRQRSAPTVARWSADGIMVGVVFDAFSTARVAKLDGIKQSHPVLYLAYFSVCSARQDDVASTPAMTFVGHNIIGSFRVAEEPSVLLDAGVDEGRGCVWCLVCPRIRAPLLRQYCVKIAGKEIAASEGLQAPVDVTCSGIVIPLGNAPFLLLLHGRLCMIELVDVATLASLATFTVPSRNGTHQLLECCVCYRHEGADCWMIALALRETRVVGDGESRSHLRVLQGAVEESCSRVRVVADSSFPSELPRDYSELSRGIRQSTAITIVKGAGGTHLSVADLCTGETWLVSQGDWAVMFPLTELRSRNVVVQSSVSNSPSIWTVPVTSRGRCVRLRRKRQAMEQRILQDAFVTMILDKRTGGGKTVQQSHLWLQRWLSERGGLFEVDGHDDAAVTAGPHCMSAASVDSRLLLLHCLKSSVLSNEQHENGVANAATEIERLLLECVCNEGRVSAFDKALLAELGIGASMLLEAALKEYEFFLAFSEDTIVFTSAAYEQLEKSVASLLSILSQSAEVPRPLRRSVEAFLRNCRKDMDSVRIQTLSDDELCWWLHHVSWSFWAHKAQRKALDYFREVVEAQGKRQALKRASSRGGLRDGGLDADSTQSAIVAIAKWASEHATNTFPVRDILGVGREYGILLSNAVLILEALLGVTVDPEDVDAHLPSVAGVKMCHDVLLRLRQTDVFPRKLDLRCQCTFNFSVAGECGTEQSSKWSSIVPSASAIVKMESPSGKAVQAPTIATNEDLSSNDLAVGVAGRESNQASVEVQQQKLREEYLKSYRGVGRTVGDADFDSDGDDVNPTAPGAIRLKGEIRIKQAQQNDMPVVIDPFPTVPKVVGVDSSVEFAGLFSSLDATAANGANQGPQDLFAALLSVNNPRSPATAAEVAPTNEANPSSSLFSNPSMQSQSSAHERNRRIIHLDPQRTPSQEISGLLDKALNCFRDRDYSTALNMFTSVGAVSSDDAVRARASAYCAASRCLEHLKVLTPVVSPLTRYAVQTDADALSCAELLHQTQLDACDHLLPAHLLAEYLLQENLHRSLHVVLNFIRFASDRTKDHFVEAPLSTVLNTQQHTNELLKLIGDRIDDYAAAVAKNPAGDNVERDLKIAAVLERVE